MSATSIHNVHVHGKEAYKNVFNIITMFNSFFKKKDLSKNVLAISYMHGQITAESEALHYLV